MTQHHNVAASTKSSFLYFLAAHWEEVILVNVGCSFFLDAQKS
jgi:hypothetical protein